MKIKRSISILVVLGIILGMFNFTVLADADTISAYITVSSYGEIQKDAKGNYIAEAPVTLEGKDTYTLNDLFVKAHDLYYEGGAEAGYASSVNEYGAYITKAWGDTSTKYGYQLNFGDTAVMSLEQEIKDGDYVDLCIYENFYPNTESYAKFDQYSMSVSLNEDAEVTLLEAGYDEAWNMVFSPCADAYILVDGVKTEIKTDAEGKAEISFGKVGKHIVSATKTKIVTVNQTDKEILAIAAPVCVVDVTVPEIVKNIAKKYENSLYKDANYPWFIADFAGYGEVSPQNMPVLSAQNTEVCRDKLINMAFDPDASAGNLAKSIIALSAMGYDAKNVSNTKSEQLDITEKLLNLVDAGSDAVTNIYTLPYVLIAVESFASGEQKEYLVNSAISQKDLWLDTTWGPDALTPMLLALSPYYENNQDVKNAVDDALATLKGCQGETGAINNEWGAAASTGLAIAGVSALGIDPEAFVNNGNSFIDGLLGEANEDCDAFKPTDNSFGTEQGLRGLVAWCLMKEGKRLYDFSGTDKTEAKASAKSLVTFNVTPADALVEIEGQEPVSGNDFYLEEGSYTYIATREGYKATSGTVEVTKEDAEENAEKSPEIKLSERSSGGAGAANDTINVNVKVMVHDADQCDNSYTYKKNASKYTALVSKTVELKKGQTVYDALVAVLDANNIDYEDRDGYIASIGGISEFDHGENSGWMFTVNSAHQNSGAKDVTLSSSAKVVWFYTDDYTKETGSEHYNSTGSGSSSSVSTGKKDDTEKDEDKDGDNTEATAKREFTNATFPDVAEDAWYYSAVKFVYENSLMEGTGEGFEPDTKMTRAMLVAVLYRMDGSGEEFNDDGFDDVEESDWYFTSVAWASSHGIVSGMDASHFAPDSDVTREQMAVMFYRYYIYKNAEEVNADEEMIKDYDDFEDISEYAVEALAWANETGLLRGESDSTLNPKSFATRAQLAAVLMRYIED